MASITLGGNPINTNGELPKIGSKAPQFELIKTSLPSQIASTSTSIASLINLSIRTGSFPEYEWNHRRLPIH